MQKIILVLLASFFYVDLSFAKDLIVCPTNTGEIAQQIADHWTHSINWYASWAQTRMGSISGSGGVHGPMNGKMPLPQNQKPKLRFIGFNMEYIPEREQVAIDCKYLIEHNAEIFDIKYPSLTSLDNEFWMTGFVLGNDLSRCHKINYDMISCY